MDGLDLTLVLDCRIWVVVVGFSITADGAASKSRATDGTARCSQSANFDNTAKAISQVHFHNKAPVGRHRASDPTARLGGKFDTGRNQREPLLLESRPAERIDQDKPMSGRRVIKAIVGYAPAPHAISGPGESLLLVPQQPVIHAGFFTSGRESPTNMLRFGILIALSVLASSVAFGGSSPLRLRM
jgi:hypothetical protein